MGIAKKVLAGAMVAGSAVAIMPSTAGAWTVGEEFPVDIRSTDGAGAFCKMRIGQTLTFNDTASIDCGLSNLQTDPYSTYVEWRQRDATAYLPSNRLYNNSTTSPDAILVHDERFNPAGRIYSLDWRVCRDLPGTDDNCSDWVSYSRK